MHLTANISVPQKNFIAIDLHSDNAVICVRRNALNKAGELVGKNIELRSSLRNFESQNEYGYKPCIKRRFQNAETLQSRNQKNSS